MADMFTPTKEIPLWINRTKTAKIREGKEVNTFHIDQPVILPLPNGGTYTLPPQGIIAGKYFENCKNWKAVQPLYIAVEKHLIHDPLNLLDSSAAPLVDWKGATPHGEPTVHSKTGAQWREYFRSAKDEAISQEYGKTRTMKRIAEFVNVSVAEDAAYSDYVTALRAWARNSK